MALLRVSIKFVNVFKGSTAEMFQNRRTQLYCMRLNTYLTKNMIYTSEAEEIITCIGVNSFALCAKPGTVFKKGLSVYVCIFRTSILKKTHSPLWRPTGFRLIKIDILANRFGGSRLGREKNRVCVHLSCLNIYKLSECVVLQGIFGITN